MKFKKLSAPSLKQLFINEIEGMILSGKMPIASKIPPERELAAKMGVSRAVVNAGLIEIARKGFIEMKPRMGAIVADYRRRGNAETLVSIMNYKGGVLPREDIKSLLEMRIVFETLALERGVPQATTEDLDRLKKLADRFFAENNVEAAAEAIFNFHHEIYLISGNTLLPLVFYSFRLLMQKLWMRYFELYGMGKLRKTTKELYDFIAKGDVEGAVANLSDSMNEAISGSAQIYYD